MSSAGSPARSGVGAPLPNPTGQSPRAAVPAPSAQTRAAATKSNARAEASRKNGAKSRGPKSDEGKARSAQNALRHGLRAEKHVVLPEEDAGEFHALAAALMEELAPVGALQTVLARRVAVAAWRLARADRLEVEVFAERGYGAAGPGVALIRDGNGTRSFETLLRYRGAAMAELMRSLKTLKALQAEQAAATGPAVAARPPEVHPKTHATPPRLVHRAQPDEPERAAGHRLHYVMPDPRGRTLHEPAPPWTPNEPEPAPATPPAPASAQARSGPGRTNPDRPVGATRSKRA
jgi:hypothetical protein